jgi:hypothetical protein
MQELYVDSEICPQERAVMPALDLDGKKGEQPPAKPADAPPASDEKPPENNAA